MSSFPIYRKYKGINVWFKIIDDRNFVELKQVGTKFTLYKVKAEQYPEMVLIQDMIACREGRWEELDREEYEGLVEKVKD